MSPSRCSAIHAATFAFFVLQVAAQPPTKTVKEGRRFPEEYRTEKECFARSHVQLEGRHIFRGSLTVTSPEDCCTECCERENCVAWMFKACCDHCYLYSDVREMRTCRTSDCVGGIIDEQYRHVEDAFWDAIPQERYRGLLTTCEQGDRYTSMGAVFVACTEVQRRCAPSRTVDPPKPLEPVRQSCDMHYDIKMYGSDYNDGFLDKKLTAEDCCHVCLRERGCFAWAWTVDGACFRKWQVPARDQWLTRIGDISGTKKNTNWSVSCGERIDGIEYDLWNPDEKAENNATSADACCEQCRDRQSCLSWSFIDNKHCRLLFSYGTSQTKNANSVSAYVITDALKCDLQSTEEEEEDDKEDKKEKATPFRIAQAHQPECASILVHGPGAERPDCVDRKEAHNIFNRAVDKVLAII